ncbi:hypothetical protein TWF696_006421 [Orbilia brochopaga]|uniref:Uncharacterized protein n=1 Tax=Orbilia brochopaga TaxID=3140254 RepID=A0AAV9UZJ7_9PEZI
MNDSAFNPDIVNPKTPEERAFAKLDHVNLWAKVSTVRDLLGLSLQPGDHQDIQNSLDVMWSNLRKSVRQLSQKHDFFDDSIANELIILEEFLDIPEIRRLSGIGHWDGNRRPPRMKCEPATVVRWFINNRREAVKHAHNLAVRKGSYSSQTSAGGGADYEASTSASTSDR